MKTNGSARRRWLTFGSLLFLLAASHIVRLSMQSPDIWWTPKPLAVPLAESADRMEVYVRGALLQDELKARRIQVLAAEGSATLEAADVTVRFNNRDRVRAGQVWGHIVAALIAGASGVFVVLSLLGLWPSPPRQG